LAPLGISCCVSAMIDGRTETGELNTGEGPTGAAAEMADGGWDGGEMIDD
jgi:hypothetical protein